VAYNFQIGNNKIKLLAEYESVTQEVLLPVESILQNAKQLQRAQFYFVVSGLKIIGHRNPDNNLESHSISVATILCPFASIKHTIRIEHRL
jgi:hypothetical protein